jgi:hypothetical protein
MSVRKLEVLEMIIDDMENDVKEFDGAPFNGRTLATIHGNLCATIQVLAKILKAHIEETTPTTLTSKEPQHD